MECKCSICEEKAIWACHSRETGQGTLYCGECAEESGIPFDSPSDIWLHVESVRGIFARWAKEDKDGQV